LLAVRPIAERKAAGHFPEAGAVSMADAILFAPARASHQRASDRLKDRRLKGRRPKGRDILKTGGKGTWWLDQEAWARRRSDRRTKAVFALSAVAVAAAVAALR
jgi:hypothetical protein